MSLATFNAMPRLLPPFFDYALRLGRDLETPILIRNSSSTTDPIDINIWAWEPVRYKYKFFSASEVGNKHRGKSIAL